MSAEKIWSDEWSKFDGHIYKFFTNNTITAREARHACRDHGALLASVNTAEEQTAIVEGALKKRTLSAFISGSDEITGAKLLNWVFSVIANFETYLAHIIYVTLVIIYLL